MQRRCSWVQLGSLACHSLAMAVLYACTWEAAFIHDVYSVREESASSCCGLLVRGSPLGSVGGCVCVFVCTQEGCSCTLRGN